MTEAPELNTHQSAVCRCVSYTRVGLTLLIARLVLCGPAGRHARRDPRRYFHSPEEQHPREVIALVVAGLIALPIGVIVAVKKDTGIDYAGKIIALLGQSLSSFWLGIVLMWIFAVMLGWLPTSGRSGLSSIIMPAVALGWYQVAAVMRLTRSSMLEVLDTEYVKLARIKGVPEWKVIWKHCLRNSAIAPLTYFGLIMGGFMTGSVVIETVFVWPGVGLLAIDALRSRDFQVVQSVVLFFAGIYIVCNLLVDILYAYLDPRIRYTEA